MRQAAALARLLQDSPAVAGGGSESRHLVEMALAAMGRVTEARIERRGDPARSKALDEAATALAQALVGSSNAQPREPTEVFQRLVVGPDAPGDVYWQVARSAGVLPLVGAGETGLCSGQSLTDLATLALQTPVLGHLSGQLSPLLEAAYNLAPALPRGTCRRSWTAHLLLRPQSLTELLETLLRTLCVQGLRHSGPSALRNALGAHPDCAAGLAAVAVHPALLLIARATLRSWLATSGNIAAWMIHWELFRQAATNDGGGDGAAAPFALYPGPLRAAAKGVHAANQSIIKDDSNGPDVATAHADVQRALAVTGAGDTRLQEEVWSLMLDAPALAAAVLEQIPWTALLEEGEDAAEDDAMDADGGGGSGSGGCCTVEGAEWLAALAWPFAGQTEARQDLATALMEGRAAMPTARAGVAALARWRASWPLSELKES